MPTATNGRGEASSFLPLHALNDTDDGDDEDSDLDMFTSEDYGHGFDAIDHSRSARVLEVWRRFLPRVPIPGFLQYQKIQPTLPHVTVSGRGGPWKARASIWIAALFLFWITFIAAFLPSYSRLPKHYQDLRHRALGSSAPGRANPNNEMVFIAASIYDKDGSLISGAWGQNVLDLIDLLGPDNVFLSVYENDAAEAASKAMYAFRDRVKSKYVILNEHLDTTDLQHVTMPDGRHLLKRIAFLAKVRNRALAPLEDPNSPLRDVDVSKLLYINDVVFDPIDAANLILSTNLDPSTNRSSYRAACATDFINPFKFYDTFATRDLEGNDMGVPFYPWFSAAGAGASRRDVLDEKDAVRVRSCWGGMVAFDASFFRSATPHRSSARAPASAAGDDDNNQDDQGTYLPARFRAEPDPFWDASECCLIHADIQHWNATRDSLAHDTGIYMNPFVRVAYDTRTLAWLAFTRRFERMYPPVQHLVNLLAKRPSFNPRRLEYPGEKVADRVWDERDGKYGDVERVARPGGFCGGRKLLALPEDGHGGRWWSQEPPVDTGD